MSTSLAEQLQKLAAPQTSLLQRDKKRASLLFEPKVAAAIDRDTFYDIGISGLHDLVKFNEDFNIFEQTLFSNTSRSIERAVETKETNAKLDASIRKFFMLLSPYLLLKSAHKALEWLIHRFSIHEYNRNDFLKLILPYHETNVFVRCLQLLKVNLNEWLWLEPVQKSGIHLPKLTLYNHAANDIGFLKFLGEMVSDALHANESKSISLTTLFSFYCTTTLGCLEHTLNVTEPQINAILPPLLNGLSSKVPDYLASSYLITAQLLKKTKLSNKILNHFVMKISNKTQRDLRAEATLLLLLVYQSQAENYTTIPDLCVSALVEADWFVVNVVKLADGGSYVLPLLVPVVKKTLQLAKKNSYKCFVEKLLTTVRFDDASANVLIRLILESFPTTNDKEEELIPITEWYSELLKRMETQYPNPFDKIVRETMSNKSSAKHRQALQHIMNFLMSVGRNIFEQLYHPNAKFRANAVQKLVKNYQKLSPKDKEMLEGAIAERFRDDEESVVLAVLQLDKKQLIKLLGVDLFRDLSIQLLTKCLEKDWYNVAQKVIQILCSGSVTKDTKLFLAILPYVFPKAKSEVELTLTILNSDFGSKFICFMNARRKIKPEQSADKICELMLKTLQEHGSEENLTDLNDCIDFKMNSIQKYLTTILFTSVLPQGCTTNCANTTLEKIKPFLNESISVKKNITNIHEYVCFARSGNVPLEGILKCLHIIFEKINSNIDHSNWFNLLDSKSKEMNKFFINLILILLKGCNSTNTHVSTCYSNLFRDFLNRVCGNYVNKINFLSNFLVLDHFVPIKSQLRLINVLHSLLDRPILINWTVQFNSKFIVPGCLIALINPVPEIRGASLKILEILSRLENGYVSFIRELLQHREELLLDNEQLPLILFSILENNKVKVILNVLLEIACDIKIPIHVTSKLLKVLTFMNSSQIFEQTSILGLHILKSVKDQNEILDIYNSEAFYNITLRFDPSIGQKFSLNSNSWKMISFGLKQNFNLQIDKKLTCPSVLIFEQFTRDLFASFNTEIRSVVIKLLIEIATVSENPDVISSVNKVMKRIDLDSNLLIDHFTQMKEVKSNKIVSQRKFRRSQIPTVDILDTNEWKYGITVLEFIQDKKKLTNVQLLLPYYFEILKKCLDFDEQSAVEYPKQLLLSSILYACVKLEAEGQQLSTTSFNMELVVQCIRASQNPQTHHHALLLLAHTAHLIPDQVLHNIMAIFTFMGSSVLRHDDAYSFQIISKIIDSVVPILIKDSNQVTPVLRVFVDAILDIPEHRRMPLYTKLLITLGIEKYLWLFLLLVFEAHVVHPETKSTEHQPKRLDIAVNVVLEFPPDVIISTTIRVLDYIKSLPVDKDDVNKNDSDIFNISQRTSKEFRHYKYTIITFLSGLLSSKQLVNTIAALDQKTVLELEPLYKNQLISILTYIQAVSKTAERMSKTPQAQYWKVMLHHSCDVMDSVNALLTSEMFLLVIRGLLAHNIPAVRRKAMEILNTKLQHQPSFFYTNEADSEITKTEDLFALLPALLAIVKTIPDEVESEQELAQQSALLSLKLLVKLLAGNYPEKFKDILEYVTDLMKSKKVKGNILASVVLCLAELCSKLRAHAIPGLVRFMPAVVKALKEQTCENSPGLLLMCIITAVQKIVDSLPLFLSPYLDKLLSELSILHAQLEQNENEQSEQFVKKLETIASAIGEIIPARVLIPIITETYNSLLNKNEFQAIGPLMNVLINNIAKLNGSDLNSLLPDLTNFFLNALQFRNEHKSISDNDVTLVEDYLIKTLTSLVLKLSETTFRPFYYKLFDWAARSDLKNEKIITFYRLSAGIAKNLKSLFVLFAGHFVKNAAAILDACNVVKDEDEQLYFKDEAKNVLLVESVLETLRSVFLYDSQNFVDKDRFETLMQPIVDQLENTLGGIQQLNERASNVLIPCIAQFAVATADDALWKQLNYQILLKSRHNQPAIRLIALNCCCEFARKLGEDFLPLLPETIPFLAELLEDEDENVEAACQKTVQDLEKILGEPLQKYF